MVGRWRGSGRRSNDDPEGPPADPVDPVDPVNLGPAPPPDAELAPDAVDAPPASPAPADRDSPVRAWARSGRGTPWASEPPWRTPATDPATDTSASPPPPPGPAPSDDPTTPSTPIPELPPRSAAPAPGVGTGVDLDPNPGRHAVESAPSTAPVRAVQTVGAARAPDVPVDRARLVQGRIGIDHVTPRVEGGQPAKAVLGEVVPVTATVWREGDDAVAATVVWQRCPDVGIAEAEVERPVCDDTTAQTVRMVSAGPETDRFLAAVVPDAEGLWCFRVDAWSDPWATWRHAVEVKVDAGQGPAELANDLEAGARLLDRAARQAEPDLAAAAAALRDIDADLPRRLALAFAALVHRAMTGQPVRELVTAGPIRHIVVERARALEGAWYEFFPRSTGGVDAAGRPVHGTFATATRELDRVAAMGFDVAYLPPIHPVGTVNRKGPNNTLTPGPDDIGSPWAIGSAEGGHDAVDPRLGTVADFDAFVARADELGLEVALDLALQCAPDHPWAAEHPEWFTIRPDGTIAYAENPPKKYQDIYPVNFDTDPEGIYREVLRVVLGWVDHGVRIFRVDNPHTKPPDFWSWLIAEVHRADPGVVFLAEAFTRPARLFGLGRAGFSQSYSYFTWRTGKEELQEFFELHRDHIDECRPNCFVNTPDILHESLQVGGPGMFALRAALAATLAPSWGVYAGFELFEDRAVGPGIEEYLDSEKYQLRPRDFAGALAAGRSLEPWLTRLNQIRREHPALRQIRTLRFLPIDNPALLAYAKTDPRTGDAVICVVTLNPFDAEEGTLRIGADDAAALGLWPGEGFAAVDEVTGRTFDWGQVNYVRLEPWRDVAHVVSVLRR